MINQIRTSHPLLKIFNFSLVDLPSPNRISYLWNFGSLLGICLGVQIVTGLFLAIQYSADVEVAFNTIIHIARDVEEGWFMRLLHANGASVFFICLYLHVGRGIYYGSYFYELPWFTGVALLLLVIITAFVGYVLPWGQISFWGATVITKLLSAIPYIGIILVQWLWGGFAVDNATLTRFFSFHFILPFIIAALVIIHLLFLHQTGSSSPLGIIKNHNKISFHHYFVVKDTLGFLVLILGSLSISLIFPYLLGDVENFIHSNKLVTPIHIIPEWYFLFAYAILRSIPNKLGGVIALLISILILITLPFTISQKHKSSSAHPLIKILFWVLVINVILLTWIGARPVEDPYIIIGQVLTVSYFSLYILLPAYSISQSN